jgi:hypothetical protein
VEFFVSFSCESLNHQNKRSKPGVERAVVMRIGKDLTPGTNAKEIFTKLTRGTTHLQFHLREPIHKAELSVIAKSPAGRL